MMIDMNVAVTRMTKTGNRETHAVSCSACGEFDQIDETSAGNDNVLI